MRDFAIIFVQLIFTLARLAKPGGLRSVVAESVLVRHQLLFLNRGCKRAPNLRATDRIIAGLCTLFMRPARVHGEFMKITRQSVCGTSLDSACASDTNRGQSVPQILQPLVLVGV